MKQFALSIFFIALNTLNVLNAQDNDTICPTNPVLIEANSQLRVFPNPSEGQFQIVYASTNSCPPAGWGGVLMINIISETNKTVYTETIDVFDGEKGVYTIEMIIGKKMKVRREIIR